MNLTIPMIFKPTGAVHRCFRFVNDPRNSAKCSSNKFSDQYIKVKTLIISLLRNCVVVAILAKKSKRMQFNMC